MNYFLKGFFNTKLKAKNFNRISFVKLKRDFPGKKTRASLARAAFRRNFLYNHGGRRSIAGTAQLNF